MSIPAQAGVRWGTPSPLGGGALLYTVTFTAADQVTDPLEIYERPITTVHIFGTFNGQTVTLKGFNVNTSAASPQNLHRADASSSTFSTVGSELLAAVLENPRYFIAQSDGAVTSVTIAIICIDRKGK